MAMRVETNPLEAAYAVLLDNGLDGAGEALRILVNEAARIERAEFLGAAPYERTATRRDYANGFKPKTLLTRVASIFPNPDACLRLISALLAELDDDSDPQGLSQPQTVTRPS